MNLTLQIISSVVTDNLSVSLCYRTRSFDMSTNEETTSTVEQVAPGHSHCDEEGNNTKFIRCIYCPSLILRPKIASIVDLEKTLPKITGQNEPEKITKFWCVQDIFNFENCSFSKTVENMKYLCCCDCDIGPIGYQDLDNSICYIATERVSYAEK